jgi:hypothetical protein
MKSECPQCTAGWESWKQFLLEEHKVTITSEPIACAHYGEDFVSLGRSSAGMTLALPGQPERETIGTSWVVFSTNGRDAFIANEDEARQEYHRRVEAMRA